MIVCQSIRQVAILGVPDKTWGKVGIAAFVKITQAAATETAVQAWLKKQGNKI